MKKLLTIAACLFAFTANAQNANLDGWARSITPAPCANDAKIYYVQGHTTKEPAFNTVRRARLSLAFNMAKRRAYVAFNTDGRQHTAAERAALAAEWETRKSAYMAVNNMK